MMLGSKEMKDKFCLQDKEVVFCNHGSYGAVPKRVLQKRFDLLGQCENHPDKWFRVEARQKYDINLARVASFLGSQPQNMVFVENPTTGINAVMNCLKMTPKDSILMYSHTYNAVKNIVNATAAKWGANVHCIQLPSVINSEAEVVDIFTQAASSLGNVKIAIIDHISSASAILFPVDQIIKALRRLQKPPLILIDGAHAPGQVAELKLDDLEADFYTGTLHKWCYATKGTAFLWVHPKHQDWVRPLVTSHNYNKGFQEEFYCQGTGDLTRYLCVEEALDFYQSLGGQPAISQHAKELLDFGEKVLLESFKNVSAAPFPQTMRAPYMRIVEMPKSELYPEVTFDVVEKLMPQLAADYQIVTALTFFNKKAWIRLSANVYNDKMDYVKLRDRLAAALQITIVASSK